MQYYNRTKWTSRKTAEQMILGKQRMYDNARP
jgi:hypothetical protein